MGKEGRKDIAGVWIQSVAFLTRVLVWAGFFAALYVLRGFSVLVFLTFVFSYIQAHGVRVVGGYVKSRTVSVVTVGALFLALVVGLGAFLIPQVVSQAEIFADNYKVYLNRAEHEVQSILTSNSDVMDLFGQGSFPVLDSLPSDQATTNAHHHSAYPALSYLFSFSGGGGEGSLDVAYVGHILKNIGNVLLASVSSFLLAILFSFLIVLDLPRLTKSVRGLKDTKVGFIYEEVSDSIKNFAATLGHALEAQLFIALVNTFLTAFAIYIFGIGTKLAFLSLIVFLCSFIPVAGVFLSSIPICLLVLEEAGFSGVLLMALVIWGIHLVEAYILNPKIFGNRLHINPVLVLIILTLSGKLFGVWGLLLGVPVCSYLFSDAIRFKGNEERAQRVS